MSGVDKIAWQIAPGQEQFTDFLLTLNTTFPNQGSTIYQARNELKEITVNGSRLVVKSFGIPNALRRYVYGRLRQSKAEKSFYNAIKLQSLGLPTPRPIGFIEYYFSGGLYQSFYVSHEWPNAQTIRGSLADLDYPHRQEILEAFGRFIWKLHQNQVYHRDFSPGNILFSSCGGTKSNSPDSEDPWQFSLVDVNRMNFGPLSLDARMKNFKMLWLDDKDLKSIVSAYAAVSSEDAEKLFKKALAFSNAHKCLASQKERLKTLLGLH